MKPSVFFFVYLQYTSHDTHKLKTLSFQAQDLLPGIILDKDSGTFEISGVSCPADGYEFYRQVFVWLDEYITDPLDQTVLDFRFNYFNTVSAKIILKIMIKMEDLSDSGHEVKIRWFFDEEDEDLEEAGEEFENIVDLNFEFVSVKYGKDTDDNVGNFDFM